MDIMETNSDTSTSSVAMALADVKQEPIAYFACRECSEVFFSDVNLKVHLLSHNKSVKVGCTKCDNVHVYDIKQLRQHVSTCHIISNKSKKEILRQSTVTDDTENIESPGQGSSRASNIEVINKLCYQLACPMCEKAFDLMDKSTDIEKHIEHHSNIDVEKIYCIAAWCKENDRDNKTCYISRTDISEYLSHVASHCAVVQHLSPKVSELIQCILRTLLSKLNSHYPDCIGEISKNLQNEDSNSATALFIQEVISNMKSNVGSKNRMRKLTRQHSLNSDKPQHENSLARGDSISGEFGGLHVAKCDLCDILFQSTVEAQVHGLAHRGETTAYLSCALCNQTKKYLKVDALRQHLKCHSKLQQLQQQQLLNLQQPQDLLTTFVGPPGIITYLNQQQQQLQKTLSEDHGPYIRDQKSGDGPLKMKREASCPGELAASGGEGDDGGSPSQTGAKRLRFSESQVFHCHECDISFQLDDFTDFCQHLQQHLDGSKLFRCHVCKKRFAGDQIRPFVKHLCSHMLGKNQRLHCSRCGATFADDEIDEFYGHVSQHKQHEVFHCDACAARFSTSKKLIQHLTSHSGCGYGDGGRCSVSCGVCKGAGGEEQFDNVVALVVHVSERHEEVSDRCLTEVYTCDKCPYNARCPLSYQRHMLQQHSSYISICSLCLHTFADQGALTQHLTSAHTAGHGATAAPTLDVSSVMGAVYKAITGDSLHCCHQCGIYFEQESVYAAHMIHHDTVTHVGEDDLITCNTCQIEFATNIDLACHLMAATCNRNE